MLRLVLPSMLYQESVDKRAKPALKNIIGLNSPVFMDQCVFRVTLVMRIVQILLTASSDLANEGRSISQLNWALLISSFENMIKI